MMDVAVMTTRTAAATPRFFCSLSVVGAGASRRATGDRSGWWCRAVTLSARYVEVVTNFCTLRQCSPARQDRDQLLHVYIYLLTSFSVFIDSCIFAVTGKSWSSDGYRRKGDRDSLTTSGMEAPPPIGDKTGRKRRGWSSCLRQESIRAGCSHSYTDRDASGPPSAAGAAFGRTQGRTKSRSGPDAVMPPGPPGSPTPMPLQRPCRLPAPRRVSRHRSHALAHAYLHPSTRHAHRSDREHRRDDLRGRLVVG